MGCIHCAFSNNVFMTVSRELGLEMLMEVKPLSCTMRNCGVTCVVNGYKLEVRCSRIGWSQRRHLSSFVPAIYSGDLHLRVVCGGHKQVSQKRGSQKWSMLVLVL